MTAPLIESNRIEYAPTLTSKLFLQGQIQDFHLGGGGRKRLRARAHIMSTNPEVPYIRPGSRARLGPWKLSGVLMLSCTI